MLILGWWLEIRGGRWVFGVVFLGFGSDGGRVRFSGFLFVFCLENDFLDNLLIVREFDFLLLLRFSFFFFII